MKTVICAVLLLAALPALASGAAGHEADASSPGPAGPSAVRAAPPWEFSLQPYAFLTGLAGSVTAGDVTFPVNSSFGDLVDNLRVGGFVALAGTRGRWGFVADFEYMSLKGSSQGRVPVELRLDTTIGEVDATFAPAPGTGLRFVGGVRVVDFSQTLTVTGDSPLEARATVVDPVIGAVGAWDLGDCWRFRMRGDIGGFGVGSESTYQLMLEVERRLSGSVGLPFGYRVLGVQVEQDGLQLDARLAGLFLGLDFHF